MNELELKPCPFCGRPPHPTKEIPSAHLAALIICSENGCATIARSTLSEAAAAWNRRDGGVKLFGPYGHLNGHRALTEDTWDVEADPIENNEEYFSIPLFAKVEPIYPVSYSKPEPVSVVEGWRPIETAPTDGTEVIGINAKGTIARTWFFAPSSRTKNWLKIPNNTAWKPTRWMPIPEICAEPPPPESRAVTGRHPVETLWRQCLLPEYFLGNDGSNHKLYRLYDAIRAAVPSAPAARVGVPSDATPKMVKAALSVDWSNENEEATVHNVWHAMISVLPTPTPAPDAPEPVAWMPIDSAPKDGTIVDLWHEEFDRQADMYWGKPQHCCGEDGQYCDGEWHSEPEGWVCSSVNQTIFSDGYTHWRLPPVGPAVSPKSCLDRAQGDNQPRYTTKRLHDEIAKAKEYARREALTEAAIKAHSLIAMDYVADNVRDQILSLNGEPLDLLTPAQAWQELCETPDITSPEEYPDHALITMEQLADYMRRATTVEDTL